MSTTVYKKTALTGGAASALDSIDGNSLLDGDFAFVFTGTLGYFYHLNATSGAAESSPAVISPDTNAGTKRWILQSLTLGTPSSGDLQNCTWTAKANVASPALTGTATATSLSVGSGSSELITNSNFDAGDVNWSKDAGWTIVDQGGGQYEAVATNCAINNVIVSDAITLTTGRSYIAIASMSNYTDGSMRVEAFDGGSWQSGNTISALGVSFVIITATTATAYVRVNPQTAGSDFRVGLISLMELPMQVSGNTYLTGNLRVVIPTYANNAAALAGGLLPGQLYRVNAATDPEPLYIVHA